MKSLITAVAIILLFIPMSSASVELQEWDTDISVNMDGSAEWAVSFLYNETISKTDYFLLYDIDSYEAFGDGSKLQCLSSKLQIGNSIECSGFKAKSIVYRIKIKQIESKINDLFTIKTRLSVIQVVDVFSFAIKLPVGAALVEKSRLGGTSLKRFEPSFGAEGSDGRRIFVKWISNEPRLGETFDVSIIYEKIETSGPSSLISFIIGSLVVLFLGFVAFVFYRKKHSKDILPVLSESERNVMKILMRENKKIDQRSVVKETQYSKAKVSRIIKELESRNLVEKTPKGRTNMLKAIKPKIQKKYEETPKNISHEYNQNI